MPSNWPPCFVGEGPLSGKALCRGRPFVGEGPLSGKALCWGRLFVGEGLLLAANFPTKGNIEVLQLVIVFKYSCIIRDLTAFRTTRLQVLICNMDSSYWWRHRLVAMPFPGKRSTRRNILKNYIMVCQLDKRCKSFNFCKKLKLCELNSGTKEEFLGNFASNMDIDCYHIKHGIVRQGL